MRPSTTLAVVATLFPRSHKRRPGRWLAGTLLAAGLAGCGQAAESANAAHAPAPAALAPPATAPATGPAPTTVAAAPAPVKKEVLPLAKPKKPLPAAPQPTAAPAPTPPPVAASPTPDPVAAPAAPAPPTTRTQAGRVLDEAGQPLVGATVMLQGSAKGTSTDANGSYSFEVPAGENTFIFGYGGYEDEVAKGHDGQPLTVTLLPTPGKDKMRKKRR